MDVLYVGSFPPPYGGVTRKNEMLFEALSVRCHSKRIAAGVGAAGKLRQFVTALFGGGALAIGLGSNSSLRFLSLALLAFAKSKMKRSVVFVMGGTLHEYASRHSRFLRALGCYSRVYVESDTMMRGLSELGVGNVGVLPNCRVRPENRERVSVSSSTLRCLFYARICPEKGAEIALEVARALPDVLVDFWGELPEGDYKMHFKASVDELSNCEYRGVFRGSQDAGYRLLASYDLLLFPSTWAHEGVAGTLVESKVVGLPAVVFDNNFNAEVVRGNEEGLVVERGKCEAFVRAVDALNGDRQRLRQLSKGAYRSADRFFLDSYFDGVCESLGLGTLADVSAKAKENAELCC